MAAPKAYQITMEIIRERLVSLETPPANEAILLRAERIAFHVRKIIEGVAFAALSVAEHRNSRTLKELRKKDADKLLSWLNAKGMLSLPRASRPETTTLPDTKFGLRAALSENLSLEQLKAAYSRASALVHERHPEEITAKLDTETVLIEEDARRLRSWLWLHIMFFPGGMFLVQMGQYGTTSFFTTHRGESDLPPGVS
jgi:hypothetical protein